MNRNDRSDAGARALAAHGETRSPVEFAPAPFLSVPFGSLSTSAPLADVGLETLASSLQPHHAFAITHAGEIAAAGRAGRRLAAALGFSDVLASRLVSILTEAGTNMLKHASGGRLFVTEARGMAGPAAARPDRIVPRGAR